MMSDKALELYNRLQAEYKRRQNDISDVVYRLDCSNSTMEELFQVEGYTASDAACKAIYEEIRDNYDFHEDELYPVIRFHNVTEYVGVMGVVAPIGIEGKVYGITLDCEPDTLKEANVVCKALYECDGDFDARWEQLKEAIQEYHLFNDVCGFVADKILEGRA